MPNNWNLGELLKPIAKVKLKGGVVGKLSLVMIVSALALAMIAVVARDPYVSGGVAILLFILVMVLGNRLVNFANHNPQAALFEGAEFLAHEQLRLGMKGNPEIIVDASDAIINPETAPNAIAQVTTDQPRISQADSGEHERG